MDKTAGRPHRASASTPDEGQTRALIAEFNRLAPGDARGPALLALILGTADGVVVRPPLALAVGGNVHFEPGCFVDAGCAFDDRAEIRVGAFTQFAAGARVETMTPTGAQPVRIGRNAWIGAGAVVRGGVVIGDDTIVVGGSVVASDVPPGATVAGDPARPVG